jgi:hypothetical protein
MTFKSWAMFGLIPLFTFAFWNNSYTADAGAAYYMQLGIEVEHKGLFANGFIQNTFFSTDGLYFGTDDDIYLINIGYKNDFVEFGYKHCCTHPVIPYLYQYGETLEVAQEGAWDELYVKLMFEYRTKEKRQ